MVPGPRHTWGQYHADVICLSLEPGAKSGAMGLSYPEQGLDVVGPTLVIQPCNLYQPCHSHGDVSVVNDPQPAMCVRVKLAIR